MSAGKYRFFPRRSGKNPRAFLAAFIVLALCLWAEQYRTPPAAEAPSAEIISGRVSRVQDGDTFSMIDSAGREIKVRLFGVDAPELAQAHGPESGRVLRGLIHGREIQVESRGYDRYERLLGLVNWPDGRSLAYELVAAGAVWVYEDYCRLDQCAWLRKAQEEARAEGRGLWAEKAVAPWRYRRGER